MNIEGALVRFHVGANRWVLEDNPEVMLKSHIQYDQIDYKLKVTVIDVEY